MVRDAVGLNRPGRVRIALPAAFVRSTLDREGPRAEPWLHALPDRVTALCRRWGLLPDGPVMHGYVGVVIPVRRGEEALALKVSWIDRSSEHEALALQAWNGAGAVRLLDADPHEGALLLERLDSTRTLLDLPLPEALEVAGALLRRLAIPSPPGVRTVAQEVEELRHDLPSRWEATGRPFPRPTLDRVLELADPAEAGLGLLVNQDLHYENVLAGEREPWLVIDPKPLAGPPEFGVAPLLWNRFAELGGADGVDARLRHLVRAAELDPDQAWRWSTVRIADAWIWSLEEGMEDDAARFARLLEWLLAVRSDADAGR